jgi:hypothetical protein
MARSKDLLLLFGDQASDIVQLIRELYRQAPHCASVDKLLATTSRALQYAIHELACSSSSRFGSFDTVLSLAEQHKGKGCADIAISAPLLLVAQLGLFLL